MIRFLPSLLAALILLSGCSGPTSSESGSSQSSGRKIRIEVASFIPLSVNVLGEQLTHIAEELKAISTEQGRQITDRMPRSPQFVIASESSDSALPAAREKEDQAAAHGVRPNPPSRATANHQWRPSSAAGLHG